MKIVKVESIEEMTQINVYYEFDGEFYAKCNQCGKLVAIDYHRTAEDLLRDDDIECFCSKEHREVWIANEIIKGIYQIDFYAARRLAAEALNTEESNIAVGEIEKMIYRNTITKNEARNGKSYLWYYDEDGKEAIYDLESGVIISGDEAAKFSEEQFA